MIITVMRMTKKIKHNQVKIRSIQSHQHHLSKTEKISEIMNLMIVKMMSERVMNQILVKQLNNVFTVTLTIIHCSNADTKISH